MQKIKFGNMLQLNRGMLVHGCNAQGVMGSGIAAQIRFMHPQVYEDYFGTYRRDGLKLGEVVFSELDASQGFYVANAITQQHFGKDGKKYVSYEAVYDAFKKVFREAEDRGISVHYPMIGAGLAGGDWSIIQACIDAAYDGHTIERTLWIFE
jgi:O-acetyl-ADP-ribose deacetylase (regulator of RNase III)